jgi:hypothetical protein
LTQPESIPLAFDPLKVPVSRERLHGDCIQSLDQRGARLRAHLADAPLGGAGQNEPHACICRWQTETSSLEDGRGAPEAS